MNMDWLLLLLLVLIIYNSIYDFTRLKEIIKNSSEISDAHSSVNCKSRVIDLFITGAVYISVLIVLILVIWTEYIPPIVLVVLVTVPTVFQQINEAIKASESLSPVVLGYENRDLTFKDKLHIEIVSVAFLYLNTMFPFNKIVMFINNSLLSISWTEITMSVFVLLYVYIFSFLFVVELIVPFYHLRLAVDLIVKVTCSINKRLNDFKRYRLLGVPQAHLSSRVWDSAKDAHLIKKMLLSVPFIIAFFLDYFVGLLCFSSYWIVFVLGGAVLEFLMLFGRIIVRIIRFITSIPGRRVLKGSFRLSGIVSVTICVIASRLSLFCYNDDDFIGIVEFIASAIIIPIIFEWIYNYNRSEERIE